MARETVLIGQKLAGSYFGAFRNLGMLRHFRRKVCNYCRWLIPWCFVVLFLVVSTSAGLGTVCKSKARQLSSFTLLLQGELNPHGLSLYLEGGMQRVFVYVVNHPPFNEHPPADVVLKFLWEVDKGQLVYQKTFSDPEFVG